MEKDGSKQGLKKGTWKPEEDLLLTRYIETYGEGNWATVSKRSGLLRGGKSCRLRWKNYLRPNLKRGEMSEEEEDLIIRMHKLVGNRWSLIAGRLPGRTDNAVKNYWNTHLIKKIVVDKVVAAATRKTKRANTCTSFSENTSKKGSEISMKVEEEIRQELVKGDEDHPQTEPYALTNDMVPVNHETMSWQPGGESPYYEDPFLSSLQSINLLESFRDSMESTIGPWTFLPKDMYSPFF